MMYYIGGENIVAILFSRLLKNSKFDINTVITYEEIEDYSKRLQDFLDNNDSMQYYEKMFYTITKKPYYTRFIVNLPPLEFIVNRNYKIFEFSKDANNNDCIGLKSNVPFIKDQLIELWPRNNIRVCYIMMELVDFRER